MTSLALEPIYGSLLFAAVSALAVVAVLVFVTPPTQNPSHRRILIALRVLAALVLLLAIFRPAFLRTDTRPTDAALIVAVDTSRSMTLPDGDGNTRWDTQVQAWATLANGLSEIDDSLSLRLLAYDATARQLASVKPDALQSQSPNGELTDLSAAALATIQSAEGQPIAGVVFMGDGTQTAPLQGTGAQRIVETLNSLGVPFWTVPIGPAGGESASRDVAIDSLPESFQMFSGNEVEIQFQVLSRGLAGVELPVRLMWLDQEGNSREVANRSVLSDGSSAAAAVTVPIRAPEPGTYRLKVEAVQQEGELVTTNNAQIAFVEVREGGGRILYMEGSPRLEQTFLRRSLRRFPDLDLTYRWIPSDTSDRWPIDLLDWFRPGKFDIYIIGDLDSSALGQRQLTELSEAVGQGAGLIMLGGYHSFAAGGYAGSPLADVLPVEMGNAPAGRSSGGQPNDQIQGPIEIRLSRNHPITDIGGDDPTAQWQSLPPLLGANRLQGPKIAPGVTVLLETQQADPLLVIGQYGRGRTAASAMDSTWRWWRGGQSEAHRRFWRQLILWLLGREDTGDDAIQIEMDARRFAVTLPPSFRARVQSTDGTERPLIALVAEIIDAANDSQTVTTSSVISSDSTSNAGIRGEIPSLPPGFYKLRVRPESSTTGLKPQEMAFQVIDESRELAQPMADPVYLQQLAELTTDHGGAAFSPDEIDSLIETIRMRRRQAETPIIDKYTLGDGPISGWILFVLFAGALSTEWFLRRQWGLA